MSSMTLGIKERVCSFPYANLLDHESNRHQLGVMPFVPLRSRRSPKIAPHSENVNEDGTIFEMPA
jgi:hypothetical protein